MINALLYLLQNEHLSVKSRMEIAMGSKPRISVLMPARNCENSVGEAIESNIHQTFEDWEMLIADDGSTDNTRAIIDGYTDPRIRCYHSDKKLGVVQTRNKLLQQAQGDLIAWLDADDISYPLRLEKLIAAFDDDPDLMLCGSNVTWRLKFSGEYIITNHPLEHEKIIAFIAEHRRVPFKSPSTAFRRDILNDIPGYRPFFSILDGDIDFILRVSEKFRVGNIPDVVYEFRYTRNSISRQFDKSTFLKIYLPEIHFFLKEQREQDAGLDGLMDGGDKLAFDCFLADLETEFMNDRSIIFRRSCQNKLSHQDYSFAVLDAMRAIRANPQVFVNYWLLMYTLGSLSKALLRMPQCFLFKTGQT